MRKLLIAEVFGRRVYRTRKGASLMHKSLLFAASIFFVLHAGTGYGLDVTLGPTGDHQDLESAVTAVHNGGGGKITILDNGLYQGSNAITLPVDIVFEGNPVDPPTLMPSPTCENPAQTAAVCGGIDDDPVTTTINESTHRHAIVHMQGGNRLPDLDAPDPNTAPSLPPVPLDGGSITFNGCMFRSCFDSPPPAVLPGYLTQCQYVQLGDDNGRHPVQNYTVSFNDCIFEDVDDGNDNIWPNAHGANIVLFHVVQDTTLNFDNCIIPWNQGGTPGHCLVSFITARRGGDATAGLDININQCTIVDKSTFNTYHNFIHTRKPDTVIVVKNSIIWPNMTTAYGGPFAEHGRFVRSFNGQNASFCHEHEEPARGVGASTVANGGSGYAVDDLLTLVGGNQTLLLPDGNPDTLLWPNPEAAVFRVSEVDNGGAGPGAVTEVTLTSGPFAYAQGGRPTNPVTTTTDGAGDGLATLNVVWKNDIVGTLLMGEIRDSIARWDVNDPIDTSNEYDWFKQADPHGVVAIGTNVRHAEPMLVNAEGLTGPTNNRDPLDLIAGNALLPGSPAMGHGDMGQDAGYIRPTDPPTGACNLRVGAGGQTCLVLTALQCLAQSGTYFGDDAVCPTGACNLPGGGGGGTCAILTAAQCSAQNGSYIGDETPCPTGACQLPGGAGGGNCVVLTAAECLAQNGTYVGDRTVCAVGLPGDCNQDGTIDLSDGISFLSWFFQGIPLSAPAGSELCLIDPVNATAVGLQIMDWNGDVGLDLSDGTGLLTWFFGGAAEHDLGQVCIQVQSPDCISTCVDSQ